MIHTIQFYSYVSLEEIREAETSYSLNISEIIKKIEGQYNGVRLTLKKMGLGREYIIYLFLDAIKLLGKDNITESDYILIQQEIDNISKGLCLDKD